MLTNCCTSGFIHEGEPSGKIQKLANYDAYVAGELKQGAKFIIFLSDVFGIPLINNRLLADTLASGGYTVVIPDLFQGDAIAADGMSKFTNEERAAWFARHPFPPLIKPLEEFLAAIKREFSPSFVGATGYCYGARPLLEIAIKDRSAFDAGAIYHPSFLTTEIIESIPEDFLPLYIGAAENDTALTPELRTFTEAHLRKVKAKYLVALFSGADHGFSVRGDLSIPQVKFAKEKSITDTFQWFKYVESLSK